MEKANNILLKLLGLLLLTAAALKGWQLITEPVANKDIWSYRPFLIFTVEFELALGIWLLSGLFKKAAWLAALLCFSLFSAITLYKGISGADSCGCFGSVKVNPWITLFAVDIPSILALVIFRQKQELETQVNPSSIPYHCENHACQECKCQDNGYWVSLASRFKELYKKYTASLPSLTRLVTVICTSLVILALSACVLVFNEHAKSTSEYEVLEPEAWVGQELPILKDIDIGKQFKKDTWLVLFYHYDCPDCITTIKEYQRYATDLAGNGDALNIAFIEVPPYGESIIRNSSDYAVGKLLDTKEWFVTTPAIVLLESSTVQAAWEGKVPDLDAVLRNVATLNKMSPISEISRKEVILARSKIEFKNK